MRRCLILACVMALLPSFARADEVFLKGGGKVSGRILSRTDSSIVVDVGAGTVTFPMTAVDRIEERRTILDDYYERAEKLGARDRDGWLQLAQWASGQGLAAQARAAYGRVVAVDPAHAEANRGLGRVELNGRWVTEEESYAARGYVRFEGEWMRPADRDSILAYRAAVEQAEWARLDAERRARDAEARAIAAEARAREAEARARDAGAVLVAPTIPFWWRSWAPAPRPWWEEPSARPAPPGGRPRPRPEERPASRPPDR